jgi:type VI protein secretion system component VasK
VIKDSPGFYYFASALFGVVTVIMFFAAYWSFEAEKTRHVIFSLLMAAWGLWIARMCFRRAGALGKKEPTQLPETTRGK